ncbi:MBL fold metallo-hydrolase [Paenibacillus sp. ATY16]|uniref:MBL fold metallo-hydrolase n=1 Tax=Paenibacillus sp. ATY16 TaxID=1759312 RepID=UPI00201085F9|nr:MBL fold metallo-hydrolase [Paenibacillus sp. ATY16]MCK9862229.1 MBL fold metallo-hydrolase [Paenibacillus sp. ATY16]
MKQNKFTKFTNSEPVQLQNSIKHLQRWRQERLRKIKTKDYSYSVPSVEPDLSFLHENRAKPSLTWVGHSTFFIQLAGKNMITDPVWAGQMAFQRRLTPPGLPIEEVPPVDIILISHSHYDHLHIQSLRRLQGSKLLLVPAGLRTKLRLKGFTNVRELHWWESVVIDGIRITFVPSQHWTRRNLWDMNSSHWGGWVMEPADKNSLEPTIYFAGDSGYFSGFREIGSRFDIDVALMPIGAYEPEWFMGPQHVTPEEALQAFEDTGAKWFVPMHYGAFKLADDTPREALDRLANERERIGLDEQRVRILLHGETWRCPSRENNKREQE